MKNDGYGLDKAVGQDKTSEAPEGNTEKVIREDPAVEEEDGELDCGNGRAVKKFDGKDILSRIMGLLILR